MSQDSELERLTKVLAEREECLLNLWSFSADILAVFRKSEDGQIVLEHVSPAIGKLLGWKPSEIEGKPVENLINSPMSEFSVGESWESQWWAKGGGEFPETQWLVWKFSNWVPLEGGRGMRCYATARTNAKHVENAVARDSSAVEGLSEHLSQ